MIDLREDYIDKGAWIIGAKHPVFGEVEMMGTIEGEAYRWFVNDKGVVSMIPLAYLHEEDSTSG